MQANANLHRLQEYGNISPAAEWGVILNIFKAVCIIFQKQTVRSRILIQINDFDKTTIKLF